jgi:carboxymethylenebutenolidase
MVHLLRPEGHTSEELKLSRRGLAGLMFAGYALGAGPASAQAPITTDAQGLFTSTVSIPSDGFQLPAYLAMPANARRRPVVLVVPEVFGLHEYIRDVCRRLAKLGYVAIAPDLFARAGDPAPLSDFAEIRKIVTTATNAQVLGDLEATLRWLDSNPSLGRRGGLFGLPRFADTSRVGITGFCWGGAVVWMAMAASSRFKAGVAWYGRLSRPARTEFLGEEERPWPLDVADDLHGPVLGLYAGQDRGIPLADVERMRAALRAAGDTRSEIVVYPNVGHAFHADYRSSYDRAAAEDGWRRLTDWFRRNL